VNAAGETPIVDPAIDVRFGPDGLIAAVIQDVTTRAVLMVGFMNAEAVHATRTTGHTHFWSRSRQKLWRKGETSGHKQVVREMLINCEQNSLLLLVDQTGAVCHDGYVTCYYRRVQPDGSLETVEERQFDPQLIYGDAQSQPTLSTLTRQLFAAYEFLKGRDLESISTTSRLLRAVDDQTSGRVGDELRELAGVLDGSHGHQDPHADALLEVGQVIYWLVLSAIRGGCDWGDVRPDRALLTADSELDAAVVARMLRAEADRWAVETTTPMNVAARCHAALALVGQACQTAGVSPTGVVTADLNALRAKPYLASYFEAST